LLGFAISANNLATGEFGEDLCFRLNRFGINMDDILV